MPWHVVKFHRSDSGTWIKIFKEFEQIFITSDAPNAAAILENTDDAENREIYFSPTASKIAGHLISELNGAECPAPSKIKVKPVVYAGSDFAAL